MSLLALLWGSFAALSHADYNGGEIINQSDPSPGGPLYSGDITIDYNVDHSDSDVWYGGVHLYGVPGSNTTTTLEGNIAIRAGYDFRDDTETLRRNHGIHLGNDDWSGNLEMPSDSHIVLKTRNTSDRITIDSYAAGGYGVALVSMAADTVPSTILLDGSSSASGVQINLHNTTNNYRSLGIATYGIGTITVKGELGITAQTAAWSAGILAKNNAAGPLPAGMQQVVVDGNATISMTGDTALGIKTEVGGTITMNGHVNITARGKDSYGVQTNGAGGEITFNSTVHVEGGRMGIESYNGGTITINDKVDVTALGNSDSSSIALSANGGILYLSGASRVRQTGTGPYAYAVRAIAGGKIADVGGVAHEYRIEGEMHSSGEGSVIDLKMNGRSLFDGKTSIAGTDTTILDLAFSDHSLWQVTGNSVLTNLTLAQGSALQLVFDSASMTDIISAVGTITLEAGSLIYLTGDLSELEGNTYDFFTGTLDNQGVEFIAFDGVHWLKYEYTQTGANSFEFSSAAPTVIDEPGFVDLSPIPEPASATLGLMALAAMLQRRCKPVNR